MIEYKFSCIFTKIGFFASLLINSFFIYLTLFHIKHVKGTYKHLVIFFAFTGMLFTGIEIFAKPFAHNYNNSLIYFSLSNADFPEWVIQLLLAFWSGFYLLIVAAVADQFLYRYLCLLGVKFTKKSSWFLSLLWVLYPLIPGLIYSTLLYVLSMPDGYSDNYAKDIVFENYSLVLSKLPRFLMVPYASDGSIRWNNMIYLGCGALLVFCHYSIIIYCGIHMHFEMEKGMQKFSVANLKLQRQFFKALIFQSLGPTIFIFMPAIPVLLGPLIPLTDGIVISWRTGWLFLVIGAYPPFDSISFMMIVTEYKKLIKRRYFNLFSNQAGRTIATISDLNRKPNRMYSS